MNCYTIEASFHGFFDQERNNFEFTEQSYEEMGEHLVNSIYEYMTLVEDESRQKQIKELEKKKKKNNVVVSPRGKQKETTAANISQAIEEGCSSVK
jgi:hypothetical protein